MAPHHSVIKILVFYVVEVFICEIRQNYSYISCDDLNRVCVTIIDIIKGSCLYWILTKCLCYMLIFGRMEVVLVDWMGNFHFNIYDCSGCLTDPSG